MAKTNLKSKPRFSERLQATLQERPKVEKKGGPPSMEWTRVNNLLEHMGFVAGERVTVSADYRNKTIIIGPWYE